MLSPISDKGPLASFESRAIKDHPGESADIPSIVRSWQTTLLPNVIPKEPEEEEKPSEQVRSHRVKQTKKKPSMKIHGKMKRRLARRKSDRCILNLPWHQYLQKAEQLAQSQAEEQSEPRDSEDDWAESDASVFRQVDRFIAWAQSQIGELFDSTSEKGDDRSEREEDEESTAAEVADGDATKGISTDVTGKPPPD